MLMKLARRTDAASRSAKKKKNCETLDEAELSDSPEFKNILTEHDDPNKLLYKHSKPVWRPLFPSLNRFLADYRAKCQG